MAFDHLIMEWVQSLHTLGGSFWDALFAFFTFFGEETFLLVGVFGIYWCLDKRMGEQLLLSLYASIGINGLAKDLVRRPRPFLTPGFEDLRYVKIENPLVNTVHLKDSFSFPSGHSQCSAAFFGGVARRFKKGWVTVCCILLTLAVMTSRLYLGVHFPTDVLAGGAIGLAAALLCGWLFDRFYEHRIWLFVAAVGLTLPALFFSPAADTVKTIGVGIGALAGLVWEHQFCFSVKGSTARRLLRLVLGAALLMALRMGLKILFPAGLVFDAIRYGIMGFAATGLWPWLFTFFKL